MTPTDFTWTSTPTSYTLYYRGNPYHIHHQTWDQDPRSPQERQEYLSRSGAVHTQEILHGNGPHGDIWDALQSHITQDHYEVNQLLKWCRDLIEDEYSAPFSKYFMSYLIDLHLERTNGCHPSK